MHESLGYTFRDTITGFTGVAIGHCEYLTGCSQTLLQPRCEDRSQRPEGVWFDDQRLELTNEPRIVLDNAATPGCDIPAPVR